MTPKQTETQKPGALKIVFTFSAGITQGTPTVRGFDRQAKSSNTNIVQNQNCRQADSGKTKGLKLYEYKKQYSVL